MNGRRESEQGCFCLSSTNLCRVYKLQGTRNTSDFYWSLMAMTGMMSHGITRSPTEQAKQSLVGKNNDRWETYSYNEQERGGDNCLYCSRVSKKVSRN